MSRTDKTKPAKFQRAEGKSWREITWSAPKALQEEVKYYWGSQRTKERNALTSGRIPEPSRPRHNGHWDVY